MIATKFCLSGKKLRAKVPDYLIYEIMDGEPIHYQGYKDVLAGNKTFSEIRGTSGLQSFIFSYFQRLLFVNLNEDTYTLLFSRSGLHLDMRNNLTGDILVFDNKALPIESVGEHYVDVPPKVVIEVDIMVDPDDMDTDTYLFKKTQKLLDFGVERVIWVTTKTRKVAVATPNADWQVKDWNKEVEILEGIICNVGEYLASKGSSFA